MLNFWAKQYKVPAIPPSVIVGLVATFAFLSVLRGISYASGDANPENSQFFILDGYGGITLWGVMLAAGGASLLLSMALRRQAPIWASHVWLCAVYVCLASTFYQTAHDLGGGYDRVILPVGGVIWHGLFAFLLRPKYEAGGE